MSIESSIQRAMWVRCFYRISFSTVACHLCANTQLIFYCGQLMLALTGNHDTSAYCLYRYSRGHHALTHGKVWCDIVMCGRIIGAVWYSNVWYSRVWGHLGPAWYSNVWGHHASTKAA